MVTVKFAGASHIYRKFFKLKLIITDLYESSTQSLRVYKHVMFLIEYRYRYKLTAQH